VEELIRVSEVAIKNEQAVWIRLFCFSRTAFVAAPEKELRAEKPVMH
jgi:hypothetical protein